MKKTSRVTKLLSLTLTALLLLSTLALFSACQNGADGLSAYEIAVKNGFQGTEIEWLASLHGKDGEDGKNGEDGKDGENGKDGTDGEDGSNGIGSIELIDSSKNINEALMASVSIYCEFKKNSISSTSSHSAGSGVIYKIDLEKGDAYIITNYHVVYSSTSYTENKISSNIRVYLYGMYFDGTDNMNQTGIKAEYVGGSSTYDIAVLKITGSEAVKKSDARAIKITDSNKITPGVTAIAIGNPEGVGISVTSGVVSVESEYITLSVSDSASRVSMRVMRIDTAVNAGNSGGGLFNTDGHLIGIVNAKLKETSVENIGYAIPSNIAIGVAQNIIDHCDGKENESVIKCLMGITVLTTDTYAKYNENDGTITLYDTVTVQSLSETSMANGSIQAGDIIYKVKLGDRAEHIICRQFEMIDILLHARVGDSITLTVLRNGEEVSFTGTFAESDFTVVS